MTIPSRPAPPPPQKPNQNVAGQKLTIKLPPSSAKAGNQSTNGITRNFPAAKTRYAPTSNWSGSPFDSQMQPSSGLAFPDGSRKVPPPRPPPPKMTSATVLKKPGAPPQSINVLSNLFGRRKPKTAAVAPKPFTNLNSSLSSSSNNSKHAQLNPLYAGAWPTTTTTSTTRMNTAEGELISFDSPPSSPTLTQKSNSDCVSVDSFSSDSNFSSPNNGSVSQPESGFEDDFSASRATTSPSDPWETLEAFGGGGPENIYSSGHSVSTAPVRNLNIVSTRIQNNNDNQLCNGKSLLPPTPMLSMPTIIKPKISQKPKAPKPPPAASMAFGFMEGPSYVENNVESFEESPPMPNCAPPPPPSSIGVSLLDVINGTADALTLYDNDCDMSGPPYGIALYDFNGTEDGDLNFKENDKIYLLERMNEEWFNGRDKRGCVGIFPVNYIDIKVPLDNSTQASPSILANNLTVSAPAATKPKKIQVRSMYTFVAEQADDLSINENDLVTILYRISEDWLYGELEGRQGQFPANFLEYIPNDIPMP